MAAGGAARVTLLRAPDRGAGRLGRVGLLTAVPLLLGSGAHLVGGGMLPITGVALGLAVLLLASVGVSARRCRFPVVLGLLGVEQVVLHLLLTASASSAMCLPGGSMPAGHAGHAVTAGLAVSPGAVQACAQEHAMTPGGLMIVAHVLATVLVAWLLARGEAWWWRTVAELGRIVSARPTRRRPRTAPVAVPLAHVAVRLALTTASPRGPPLPS